MIQSCQKWQEQLKFLILFISQWDHFLEHNGMFHIPLCKFRSTVGCSSCPFANSGAQWEAPHTPQQILEQDQQILEQGQQILEQGQQILEHIEHFLEQMVLFLEQMGLFLEQKSFFWSKLSKFWSKTWSSLYEENLSEGVGFGV